MTQLGLSADTWLAVSTLLDQVLDLAPDERRTWLDALDPQYASYKPTIEQLLEAHANLQEHGFLETLSAYDGRLHRDSASNVVVGPGVEVGPYRLDRELGAGGMGTVWLAHRTDGTLKRPVALKLPRPRGFASHLTERFARERDILAGLTHPNIARLYDAGVTADGQPYLALEYVEGQPLNAYCDHRKLNVRQRIGLFLQVLDAVQYAHRNLVVHRDLKPGNILVSEDTQVHLLDFGIAKLLAGEQAKTEETELTQIGGPALTPDFASPEQIANAPITTASDVYSLGVILYELLCGDRPYRLKRGSRAELEDAILQAQAAYPSRRASDEGRASHRATTPAKLSRMLKGDLDTIVLKMLKKDPADRYPTADAVARDLRRFLDGQPVEARPDSQLYRISKFVGRHRTAVGLAAAVIVAILGSWGFALIQMREARGQRDAALFEARRAEASLQLTSFLVGEARLQPGDAGIAERLERSRALLRRQFAADPDIRASLLFEVADRYDEIRDLGKLAEVMDEIEGIARETGSPSLHARHRCAKANLRLLEGDTDGAGALVREGFAQLAQDRVPQFTARVECLIADSYFAATAGDLTRAIERGQEVAALHEEQQLTNTQSYANAWDTLTTAYSFSGDVRNALAAVRKERDTYVKLGRDDTLSYIKTLFLEATFLNRGGQRREALARSDAVLAESRARRLPDNHTQLVYRGIILAGMGRPAEALPLFDAAAAEFTKQEMRVDVLQVQILAAEALLQLGDARAGWERLEGHWPAIEEQIAAKNPSTTKGLRVRAQVLQAQGRLPEARDNTERALRIIAESGSPTYSGAGAIFRVAAEIALTRGDTTGALDYVGRAAERARRDAIDEAASADMGEVLMVRARILDALDRPEEARHDAMAALGHFQVTLDAEHPMVRQARALVDSHR